MMAIEVRFLQITTKLSWLTTKLVAKITKVWESEVSPVVRATANLPLQN